MSLSINSLHKNIIVELWVSIGIKFDRDKSMARCAGNLESVNGPMITTVIRFLGEIGNFPE
jgi:hypothetical protein